MNTLFLVIAALVIVAGIAFFFWRKIQSRRYLSGAKAQQLLAAWARIPSIADDHRKIIEADKIVDQALYELGYRGSFADKMKKAQARFPNKEQLWQAHKLRNRIAHEMNVQLLPREVQSALMAFEQALKKLCRP